MHSRLLTLAVVLTMMVSIFAIGARPTAGANDLDTPLVATSGPGLYLVPADLDDLGVASKIGEIVVDEIHDYGQTRLAEIEDPSLLAPEIASRLTPLEDASTVTFRAWRGAADVIDAAPEGDGYYIVAFQGPLDLAWQARLGDLGVTVVDVASPYGLVVRANAAKLGGALNTQTSTGHTAVRGVQKVPVEARVAPELLAVSEGTLSFDGIPGLRRSPDGRAVVRVVAWADQSARRVARATARFADPAGDMLGYGYPDAFVVDEDDTWQILQNVDGVAYVEPIYERKLMGNLAARADVLNVEPAWGLGWTGSGVKVNHNDSGIDPHPDFPSGVITATAGKMTATDNAHGTHTAGSVVGRGTLAVPTNNSGCGDLATSLPSVRGMAYGATINSNNLFDPGTTGKTTEDAMMKWAQDNGSHLSTNSWGYTSSYTYNAAAVTIDRAVRDADTSESGTQALTILFAAGNDGSGAGTVGTPGTAKNAITVGASHNARCGSYPTPSSVFSTLTSSMVDFSGRGPSQGRIKPDIVATGANILSVASDDPNADHSWDQTWTGSNYELMPGTSMATPIAAGATAVFFQYFNSTFGAYPSPALAKAALVNGAINMGGGYQIGASNQSSTGIYAQGWGRLNLLRSIQGPSGGTIKFVDQTASGLTTGQSSTRQITVNSTGVPLKVTAVWTDQPGSSGSSAPLVNNLDLIVTAPDGTVYRGNKFTGAWSTANPGATTDTANNVECVFVQTPATGTWTIEVRSANTAQNVTGKTGQDFSLVYSGNLTDGGTGGGTAPAAPSGLSATAASSSQINLSWTDNSTNESGFKIERKTGSGGTWAQIATTAAGVASYSNTGLTASTTYYYRVRAYNSSGDSSYSNEANATTQSGGGGGTSTPISCSQTINGTLASGDPFSTVRTTSYSDTYTFSGTSGQSVTITMNKTGTSSLDTWLVLKSPSGTTLAQNDDSNGTTNSTITFTLTSTGTHTIEATSYYASTSSGGQGAYAITLTCGGGGTPTELVTNGGFESGTTGWSFSTYSSVTSGSPQAGTYKAQQLGRGTTTSTTFYQAPAFPSTGSTRTLRFYLRMSSAEGTSTAYDYLRVRIKSSSGSTLTTLGTYSNVSKNTYAGWVLVTLSIPSSYAVAGNRLYFDASEDSSLQTTFYVDGVSIQ